MVASLCLFLQALINACSSHTDSSHACGDVQDLPHAPAPGSFGNFQDPLKRQSRPRKKAALQKQFGGNVRRTIYICDVDQQACMPFSCLAFAPYATSAHSINFQSCAQVTEASLADVFKDSGKIMDCRVCGDPNSAMRFAFIEFADEESVQRVSLHSSTPAHAM